MGWKEWKGKKVFLKLKNGRVYQGIITDISEDPNNLCWITLKDKFDNDVIISNSEIVMIEEEKNA